MGEPRAEEGRDHIYTVDSFLHGVEPYPCIICGLLRHEHPDPEVDDANRALGAESTDTEEE